MLANLGLNIVLPTIVLLWGGDLLGWPPSAVLGVALAGPLLYGSYELLIRRRVHHVSILGVVSVVLTGGIGLLELDSGWIAVKEAALPVLLAGVLGVSVWTPWPIAKTLLLEGEVLDVDRIERRVDELGTRAEVMGAFQRATAWVAASLLLSGGTSYVLARWLIHSPTGTDAFNEELGRLTAWSFPVVALPSMVITLGILLWLMRAIGRATALTFDELLGGDKEGA